MIVFVGKSDVSSREVKFVVILELAALSEGAFVPVVIGTCTRAVGCIKTRVHVMGNPMEDTKLDSADLWNSAMSVANGFETEWVFHADRPPRTGDVCSRREVGGGERICCNYDICSG